MPKWTHTKRRTAKPNKGLENRREANGPTTGAIEGEFLKRRRRRRLDLKSSDGALRESGRVYREFVEGRITAGEAEIRSRILRRHAEHLTSVEQRTLLIDLNRKLEELRGASALHQLSAPGGAT
jgi:hypothetical protein